MEAPVITYVGEISEPRLRGMLTSYSGLFVMLGLIVELLLGTLYGWNTAAFISSFIPIITIIAISQVRPPRRRSHRRRLAPPVTPNIEPRRRRSDCAAAVRRPVGRGATVRGWRGCSAGRHSAVVRRLN